MMCRIAGAAVHFDEVVILSGRNARTFDCDIDVGHDESGKQCDGAFNKSNIGGMHIVGGINGTGT